MLRSAPMRNPRLRGRTASSPLMTFSCLSAATSPTTSSRMARRLGEVIIIFFNKALFFWGARGEEICALCVFNFAQATGVVHARVGQTVIRFSCIVPLAALWAP